MELNILIGGEAGQGLDTMDRLLARTFFRMGYSLFSTKDYMSRIRGGHNFMQLRISTEELYGPAEGIDILLALNPETERIHRSRLTEGGLMISQHGEDSGGRDQVIAAERIAGELNNLRVANTVFAGALLKVMGLKRDLMEEVLQENFKEKIAEINIEALAAGYREAEEVFSFSEPEASGKRLLINGNQAVGLGAAISGVKFYAAYPMTPSTSIMDYLASKQEQLGMVVEQAEDEIAAINMAVGASYSGIRAMTGTSGGGFSLMNEGLGLAGITETPLVVANVQRPGPATGLPTRTEQGDLLFVINSSQGEFPLVVLAPRDASDAFNQTFRAFELADKYQLPVVILSDQFLADSVTSCQEFELEKLKNNRHLMEEAALSGDYCRYQETDDGISPRAYPGQFSGQVVLADSDEHDSCGHIIEAADARKRMVEKRARKMERLQEEDLLEPHYVGDEEPDLLLLGWGSTYGPLLEARELLVDDGSEVGLLSFNHLCPFPTERVQELAGREVKTVVVENNYSGQFARLLRSETGIKVDQIILKYDGRPFSGREIYQRIREEVLD